MHKNGHRTLTLTALDGKLKLSPHRFRCSVCEGERSPILDEMLTGPHRVTRPLSRRICQLATTEHFTHLPERVFEQQGVVLSQDQIHQLVLTVGTSAEKKRLAEVQLKKERLASGVPPLPLPVPEVQPRKVYVSCDGIMYCTNMREADAKNPGENRLIWQQMKVGCVYWQDEKERWHKRMIWGRENPEEFGQSLYLLACRCGYREADEKVFIADGGEWCWSIGERYFADATGILDWYHASEHIHEASRSQAGSSWNQECWAKAGVNKMWEEGGRGLLIWLRGQLKGKRGKKRKAIEDLIRYVEGRVREMDYPAYRVADYQIGSGMIESTAKQLVGQRLKGSGMRWSEKGALAVTALRATELNGRNSWSKFWSNLAL